MIRAVIDTNVLVSGLLSPSGNEALLLLAVAQGLVCPCISDAILEEYAVVLDRPKFGFDAQERDSLLATFRGRGEFVRPAAVATPSPDASDTKFIACALAAGADFIVTGNRRHYPDTPYGETHVINAGELIDRITLDVR